jgi:hypothetical protein
VGFSSQGLGTINVLCFSSLRQFVRKVVGKTESGFSIQYNSSTDREAKRKNAFLMKMEKNRNVPPAVMETESQERLLRLEKAPVWSRPL